MVAQPHYSAILIYLSAVIILLLNKINCVKFLTKFRTEGNNRYTNLSAVVPIRLRLVCLGLLSPDGYGCPKSLRFQRARLRLGHGIGAV